MNRQRSWTLFFPVVASFLLFISMPAAVFAGNGKVTGRVLDRETHEPIPGVNVLLTHIVSSEHTEVLLDRPVGSSTDVDGYYFILNVPPGVYVAKASIVGFNPLTLRTPPIDPDRTTVLNFDLTSAAIPIDQVVVTAERPIIKQDVAGTQEVIGTARIAEMPVLRLDDFVGKLKGVTMVTGADGNGLSVRGGSIRETDVRLDGISLQDPRTDNSYLALNSTTVQELQMVTGGFEAKYGGIRSGLLNVVTKEGWRGTCSTF